MLNWKPIREVVSDKAIKILNDFLLAIARKAVEGPASATDGNVPQYDGITGKLLKDGKALSGADATIITGTPGTSGNFGAWNVDGDMVDSGSKAADFAVAAHGHADMPVLIEAVTLASDGTEILFQTGIAYDTLGRPLLLKLDLVSNYAGANTISVYVNDDTAGTGYNCKYGINAAAPASVANHNYVGYVGAADEMCVADVKITRNPTTDDVCFYGAGSERSNTANQSPSYFSGYKLNTGNITKVRVKSAQNMKVGSKAFLYRV
jgi:hypothetical protein